METMLAASAEVGDGGLTKSYCHMPSQPLPFSEKANTESSRNQWVQRKRDGGEDLCLGKSQQNENIKKLTRKQGVWVPLKEAGLNT